MQSQSIRQSCISNAKTLDMWRPDKLFNEEGSLERPLDLFKEKCMWRDLIFGLLVAIFSSVAGVTTSMIFIDDVCEAPVVVTLERSRPRLTWL
jgi:hypothetical protein